MICLIDAYNYFVYDKKLMVKTAQKQPSRKTTKQGSKVISKKTSAKKAAAKVSAKNTKRLTKRLSKTLSRDVSLRLERKETNENVSSHKGFVLTYNLEIPTYQEKEYFY